MLSDKQNYLLLKSKVICFTSVRCGDVHREQTIFGKWRRDFLGKLGEALKEEKREATQLVLITHSSQVPLDRPTVQYVIVNALGSLD